MSGLLNMNLVKFSDGTYGVRAGWLIHVFYDFKSIRTYWWSKGSRWFEDCQTTEAAARAMIAGYKPMRKVKQRPTYKVVPL